MCNYCPSDAELLFLGCRITVPWMWMFNGCVFSSWKCSGWNTKHFFEFFLQTSICMKKIEGFQRKSHLECTLPLTQKKKPVHTSYTCFCHFLKTVWYGNFRYKGSSQAVTTAPQGGKRIAHVCNQPSNHAEMYNSYIKRCWFGRAETKAVFFSSLKWTTKLCTFLTK